MIGEEWAMAECKEKCNDWRSSSSDLTGVHAWAREHAETTGHRVIVRESSVTVYPSRS